MTYSFGLAIEVLVSVLLLVTIGYCIILNSKLKRLKADEQTFKATIAELITATETAERAIVGLKATAHDCDQTIGSRLRVAEQYCADMTQKVEAGSEILDRLKRIVAAGRLEREAPRKPPLPDSKATLAAAKAFTERRRARTNGRAA